MIKSPFSKTMRLAGLAVVLLVPLAYTSLAAAAPVHTLRPTAPRSVRVISSNTAVKVLWVRPSASASALVGYRVIARPTGKVCVTEVTRCTVHGLTNGKTYTFSVTARNQAGWGRTATVRGIPQAPAVPITTTSTTTPSPTSTSTTSTTTTTTLPGGGGPPPDTTTSTTTTTTPPPTTSTTTTTVPTSRTVTFNANGGLGSMAPETASAPEALTSNSFTDPGRSFSNWSTSANGIGTTYTNNATYLFLASVTLYARWTIDAPVAGSPVAGTYTAPVNDVIGDNGNYSPSYLQSAYNIPALTAAYGGGSGTIVALLEAGPDPNMANDLAYYRAEFGLAPCPAGTVSTSNPGCVFETVNSSGQTSPIDNSVTDWDGETALDIDMVSAICPACQILVVIIGSTGQGNQMVVNGTNSAILLGASVVDIQIAFEDLSYSASYDNALSHPGIPVIAPAGDGGYSALTWPASSPTVIAVGATVLTQLTDTGTRNGVETAANFSASGCDPYAPKPSWQTDTGCTNRMVADVSAVGQQVWSYDSTPQSGIPLGWTGTAGTSVSAPVVAGIYALAGNVAGNTTNPASWLYASANTLYQVTGGITGTCNIGYYCDASQNQNGYSGPAGLGTPGGCDSIAAFRPPNTTVAPAGCAVG